MDDFRNVLLIIPSYCPPESLPDLCRKLSTQGFPNILIVNDGSPSTYDKTFTACHELGVKVFKHNFNLGKGQALKTGIRYAIEENKFAGVVFCDDDGQHSPSDVARVTSAGLNHHLEFVIGTRDLSKMPLKSYFGNLIMRLLLRLQYGLLIPDTQSGLRFLGMKALGHIQHVSENRFSFEMICLISLYHQGFSIYTTPIQTIYFMDNSETRFKPLVDSLDVLRGFFGASKK